VNNRKPEYVLLHGLLTEMAQTEQSAVAHPRKEAARLDRGATPALAMLAVAGHAERVLVEVERLGGRPRLGKLLGTMLSTVRDAISDRMISRELSYRGTLIGLQHGLDCAVLTKAAAGACGRTDVVDFCERWLEERRPLVSECREAVTWFADHPALALQRAR
jgi:hypothetical protein